MYVDVFYKRIKDIINDENLNLTSKAIYAYFVTCPTQNGIINLDRKTILSDLNISKSCYYKYLSPLLEKNYIKIIKFCGNKNAYATFGNSEINIFANKMFTHDTMLDPRLSIKTKALLVYFCFLSYPFNYFDKYRCDIIHGLNISKSTYYVLLNELLQNKYIEIYQIHNPDGEFDKNRYVINNNKIINI